MGERIGQTTLMPTKIRILSEGDAGEVLELRRQALIDSPLAFLASPEDDLASPVESVRDAGSIRFCLERATRDLSAWWASIVTGM